MNAKYVCTYVHVMCMGQCMLKGSTIHTTAIHLRVACCGLTTVHLHLRQLPAELKQSHKEPGVATLLT